MKRMKFSLFIFLGLALLAGSSSSVAQNTFRESVNISLFTGGFLRQQNTNNNGGWAGVYCDYVPFKSYNGWSLGVFGLVSFYVFQDNDLENIYNGHGREWAGGVSLGKYAEYFSLRHSAFIGCNFGLRQSRDTGLGRNLYGRSDIIQEDWMLSVNLNINFLKNSGIHPRLLPRFQTMINYQAPYKSSASATWNNKPLEDQAPWPKSFFDIIVKESLLDIGLNRGQNLFLEPKVLASYRYEQGNHSSFFVVGLELGLRKEGRDDILAIFLTRKSNFLGNQAYFSGGLNFCPFNIKR